MSSIPIISHRLFLAAVGQKEVPRASFRSPERPKIREPQVREIPFEVVAPFLHGPEPRVLATRLVTSDI